MSEPKSQEDWMHESYDQGYRSGIEEFKEALKKEIEKEITINDKLISKDKKVFGYLTVCDLGLKKAIELIDTVKPKE